MNVVYVYRRSRSDELRYSMRSLAYVPHDRVIVVGDAPPFPYRNITVVGSSHNAPTPQDVTRNHLIRLVTSGTLDVTDRYYLFNDDFFVLEPVDSIPLYHRGPVTDLDPLVDRAGLPTASDFIDSEHATGAWLTEEHGITDPRSYSLHVPMPMRIHRTSWLALLPNGLRTRTAYGNLSGRLEDDGGAMQDVKVRRTDEHPTGTYTSTYEKSFTHGVVGDVVRSLFPDKSPYEI